MAQNKCVFLGVVIFYLEINGLILAPTKPTGDFVHKNSLAGSYTWKRLGKPLNMEKTLAENGMEELGRWKKSPKNLLSATPPPTKTA